jgi:hypothetical protein
MFAGKIGCFCQGRCSFQLTFDDGCAWFNGLTYSAQKESNLDGNPISFMEREKAFMDG